MCKRILVVAPGRKTRGGITSVIKEYEKCHFWKNNNCLWIETYIDKNNSLKIFYFLKGFIKYIFYLPTCRLVHIHLSWSVSAYRKLPFFLFAKLARKKVILHLHSGAEPVIQSKAGCIYRYMFKNADITIFLAEVIRKKIEEHFKICNYKILYNPSQIILNNIQEHPADNDLIILFAGTISKQKGTNDLIQAFSKIAPEFPKWKLILAGNGEIEAGKNLAKKLNITNHVEFSGWVSGDIKEKLFRKASIFCLPSYTEGFPMAVLDAWAYGLPVISTPVGGLQDVLVHGENSLVFQPGDINSLAKHLEELISNESLREILSRASFELSQGPFNIKIISQQLNNIYLSLILSNE